MQGLRFDIDQIGTAIKPETRGRYEAGKSVAYKTWHVNTHARTKGGRNKGRSYTNTYAPGSYINTTAEI